MAAITLNELNAFLSNFTQKTLTIQYLRQSKPAGHAVFPFPLENEHLYELNQAHKAKKEVFFMVNEGDGVIHKNKKIPRSKENVTHLSSLFIDTDDIPFSEVKAFLTSCQIKPHLIVETSPGRYHLYIFVTRISKAECQEPQTPWSSHVQNFQRLQVSLAHLGTDSPKTDASMRDISRVLRVPGFQHLKNPKQPFLTRIVKEYDHPPYQWGELLSKLDLTQSPHQTSPENPVHTPYQLPESRVNAGNRHSEMTRFLGSALENGNDEQIARLAFYQFARSTFDNGDIFLPGGKRHESVDNFIKWKAEETRIKEEENILIHTKALLNGGPYHENDVQSQRRRTDPFQLPDSFYENAPGLVGEISHLINRSALYQLPEAAFCASLSALALLKGQRFRVEQPYNHPPCSYLICLAPTGSGKNSSKQFLHLLAEELGLEHRLINEVRSAQGMLVDTQNADNAPAFVLDEGGGLLQAIADPDSPTYLKQVLTRFLQLFSSSGDPSINFGALADQRRTPIVLSKPHINILIYGVDTLIKDTFTKKSVTDGLLQRFIVVSTKRPRQQNPDPQPVTKLPPSMAKQMHKLSAALDLDTLNSGVTRIRFSTEARQRYEDFKHAMDEAVNRENGNETGLAGIYTRTAEQVGRLCCAMADGSNVIDIGLMDYTIEFMESRSKALMSVCNEEFNMGTIGKEVDELRSFIAKKSNKDGWCKYRTIQRGFRVRDSRKLKELLQEGMDGGVIGLNKEYTEGKTQTRGSKAFCVLSAE